MVKSEQLNEVVGARLKHLRESKGFTLVSLARELDITYQQVRKYESGLNRISVVSLMEVARILDIEIAEFFDGLMPRHKAVAPAAEAEPKLDQTMAAALDRIEDPIVRRRMRDLIDALEGTAQAEAIGR
ncbi:helix-turn-helix domain-containing protein [Aureimonas sp. AU12]|uniref:helix-turn-helix domain-containing protein n=1 Tax=Aureimonas sp. AU12 TaxID=1638161 RepID=UPI0007820A0E|nr:helix-turn-helix transcriptional regulator [Aureimonas sp. AU12]